jgi:DNA (cytosine-5)-methyltransferase 1
VQPFLVPYRGERSGQAPRTHSVEEPLPTVTAGAVMAALVEPFVTAYYGQGGTRSVEDPLATVTTKDRFGLVLPIIDGHALDIRFRMLQPHELAAGQGFPVGYHFAGTRSHQVKQIGNAVEVHQAEALCRALLA